MSFRYIPGNKLAASCGGCIFNFLRNLCAVFRGSCTSLPFHQQCMQFPFLLILTSICFLYFSDDGHSNRCEVVSHCGFNLHFSNNQLSTFSCTCWPFVHLLAKCLLKSFAHFWSGLFLFLHRNVWILCIFWILTSYHIYGLQIFFHIPMLVFSFCWLYLLLYRSSFVWCSSTSLFFILLLVS